MGVTPGTYTHEDIEATLREADEPLSVEQLTERIGRHESNVRKHLTTLEERGVVESFEDPEGDPGRQPYLYELAGDA